MEERLTDIGFIDADQPSGPTRKPLGPRKLSRGELVLMTALRIYVLIAVPLVVYAFFHALLASP